MKLLVNSKVLQISYVVFGGLPSLYLALLCVVFFEGTFWAIFNTDGEEQLTAMLLTSLLSLSIIGTISGWSAFFTLGIKSRIGIAVHAICITGGIIATIVLTWGTIYKNGQPEGLLIPLGPVVVGFMLLFHLWKVAQQGAQADPPPRHMFCAK